MLLLEAKKPHISQTTNITNTFTVILNNNPN
jgi:hypothetical protein